MNCMQRSVYFRYSDVLKRTIAINYGVQPKALLKWMSGRLHEVGWLIFNAIKLSVMHLTSTSFRLYRFCRSLAFKLESSSPINCLCIPRRILYVYRGYGPMPFRKSFHSFNVQLIVASDILKSILVAMSGAKRSCQEHKGLAPRHI